MDASFILNSISGLVFVAEAVSGKLHFFNRSSDLFKRRQVGEPERCWELLSGKNTRCPHCPVDVMLETKEPHITIVQSETDQRWYQLEHKLLVHDGQTEVVATATDVTYMKHLISSETQVLHHELKNALNVISLNNSLLGMESLSPVQHQTVRQSEAFTEYTARLIEFYDTTARYRKEALLNLEEIDMSESVQSLLMTLRKRFEQTAPTVYFALHCDAPAHNYFVTDPALLHSALFNLLKNAFEASHTPVIQVTVQVNADSATILITNNAEVPLDIQSQFFDMGVTTKPYGHGIGTFAARGMVEFLGGSIRLDCSRPEQTAITLSIPRLEK